MWTRLVTPAMLLLAPLGPASFRPTNAAVRRAYETNTRSVVEVIGRKKSGSGIIVGASGQVLTSVEYVSLNEAKVRVDDQEFPARVTLADARLKIALVEIVPPGPFPSAPVKMDALEPGTWLIGISRNRAGHSTTSVAKVGRRAPSTPFLEIDLPLDPGSPVFDDKGRLVALAVVRRGKACSILPISHVRSELASVPRP